MSHLTKAATATSTWIGGHPTTALRLSMGATITAGGLLFIMGQLATALLR